MSKSTLVHSKLDYCDLFNYILSNSPLNRLQLIHNLLLVLLLKSLNRLLTSLLCSEY